MKHSEDDPKDVRRTLKVISALRRKVRSVKVSGGRTVRVANSLELDILDRSLELLKETIQSNHLLDNNDKQ